MALEIASAAQGVTGMIVGIIIEARALYKVYKGRDREREDFARCAQLHSPSLAKASATMRMHSHSTGHMSACI